MNNTNSDDAVSRRALLRASTYVLSMIQHEQHPLGDKTKQRPLREWVTDVTGTSFVRSGQFIGTRASQRRATSKVASPMYDASIEMIQQ